MRPKICRQQTPRHANRDYAWTVGRTEVIAKTVPEVIGNFYRVAVTHSTHTGRARFPQPSGVQNAKEAMMISIHHPPAEITGGTIEIPGDKVLVEEQGHHCFRCL
jgi:hypothetical protein